MFQAQWDAACRGRPSRHVLADRGVTRSSRFAMIKASGTGPGPLGHPRGCQRSPTSSAGMTTSDGTSGFYTDLNEAQWAILAPLKVLHDGAIEWRKQSLQLRFDDIKRTPGLDGNVVHQDGALTNDSVRHGFDFQFEYRGGAHADHPPPSARNDRTAARTASPRFCARTSRATRSWRSASSTSVNGIDPAVKAC